MSADIFVPESSPEDAIVGPLHTLTYIVSEKAAIENALGKAYGMDQTAWHVPDAEEKASIGSYLGLPDSLDWEMSIFSKLGDLGNVQVRVFCIDQPTPMIRPDVDGTYVGAATIGFPMTDLYDAEKKMGGLGIETTIGVKEMEFQSPSGETYVSAEIHFVGPENIFLLGVKRPDIFIPVGPIDPATGIGAPAYSARCATNSDAVVDFLTEILGYEIRRDAAFPVGDNSGLRLREGSSERFVQAFSPGSRTAYLVLLDHEGDAKRADVENLGPPNRGLVMWSFSAPDIEIIAQKAKASGVKILQAPSSIDSPALHNSRTMILEDPTGFPIEIFEK